MREEHQSLFEPALLIQRAATEDERAADHVPAVTRALQRSAECQALMQELGGAFMLPAQVSEWSKLVQDQADRKRLAGSSRQGETFGEGFISLLELARVQLVCTQIGQPLSQAEVVIQRTPDRNASLQQPQSGAELTLDSGKDS